MDHKLCQNFSGWLSFSKVICIFSYKVGLNVWLNETVSIYSPDDIIQDETEKYMLLALSTYRISLLVLHSFRIEYEHSCVVWNLQ